MTRTKRGPLSLLRCDESVFGSDERMAYLTRVAVLCGAKPRLHCSKYGGLCMAFLTQPLNDVSDVGRRTSCDKCRFDVAEVAGL